MVIIVDSVLQLDLRTLSLIFMEIYVDFFLDRAGAKAKLPLEEIERRRSLFWQLLYLDARLVGVDIL